MIRRLLGVARLMAWLRGWIDWVAEIDAEVAMGMGQNVFGVLGHVGLVSYLPAARGVVSGGGRRELSREDALNLAAWLAIAGNVSLDEFREVYEHALSLRDGDASRITFADSGREIG